MIDCKLAKNYLEEKSRMCESTGCDDCRFGGDRCGVQLLELSALECVEIVQEWSDAHARKTYLSDFLEKYPNAPTSGRDGTPAFCPSDIGLRDLSQCESATNCVKCWNQHK